MLRQAASEVLKPGEKMAKMFVKKNSKTIGDYYVIDKWPAPPKRPPEYEYFQVDDLLLDLDDMFSKHVRPVTDDDDAKALKVWSRNPKRKGIQTQLRKLEQRLDESRTKAFEARSRPLNSWRLGSYDIFSAALGAPSQAPLIAYSQGQQGSINTLTAETQPSVLHLLCSNNGIEAVEEQALKDDSLLLQRLQSRINSFQSVDGPKVSASQLSEALKSQDSLTGLRRLVSQYLSCNPSGIAFHQTYDTQQTSQPDLSLNVRDVCENFWEHNTEQSTRDLLTFIGNLSQRLTARQEHIGGPLCGFGLRLSAEICLAAISRQYLNMGSEINHWSSSDQGLRDILQVLGTYLRHFNTNPNSSGFNVQGRQDLLKLLVGEVDQEDPPTVRSLILDHLQESSRKDMFQIGLDAYRLYIVLLGHLGAAALLEHEMHLFAAGEIGGLSGSGGLGNPGHQPDATVAEAFQVAIDNLVPPQTALPANLDFAGCVMLDLMAIGKQTQGTE